MAGVDVIDVDPLVSLPAGAVARGDVEQSLDRIRRCCRYDQANPQGEGQDKTRESAHGGLRGMRFPLAASTLLFYLRGEDSSRTNWMAEVRRTGCVSCRVEPAPPGSLRSRFAERVTMIPGPWLFPIRHRQVALIVAGCLTV